MRSPWVFLAMLCIVVIEGSDAFWGGSAFWGGRGEDRVQYCDVALENKVGAVCHQKWYSGACGSGCGGDPADTRVKRDIGGSMSTEHAKAYLAHRRNRLRRSIASLHEECCHEHCTIEEIHEHC